jgi:hypothetical protein
MTGRPSVAQLSRKQAASRPRPPLPSPAFELQVKQRIAQQPPKQVLQRQVGDLALAARDEGIVGSRTSFHEPVANSDCH